MLDLKIYRLSHVKFLYENIHVLLKRIWELSLTREKNVNFTQ